MTSPPRAEAPAARPGSPLRLRSARLQVTLGITLISLLVLAAVVLVANQLLWLAAERSADQRISTELANFSAYASPSHPAPGPDPDDAYLFPLHRMIGDLHHHDGSVLWVGRLFAPRPGQVFPTERLHFVPLPTDIPRDRWRETTFRIQHHGADPRQHQ